MPGPAPDLTDPPYTRTDRPAVVASFAPEVAGHAADDPVAAGIMAAAGRHIAEAVEAVCPREGRGDVRVTLTGGLFKLGDALVRPVGTEISALLPHVRPVAAAGAPLAGALTPAAALATDSLTLPRDPGLLYVPAR